MLIMFSQMTAQEAYKWADETLSFCLASEPQSQGIYQLADDLVDF